LEEHQSSEAAQSENVQKADVSSQPSAGNSDVVSITTDTALPSVDIIPTDTVNV